jgi:carbonic anhydrase
MKSPSEALILLREGNLRYTQGIVNPKVAGRRFAPENYIEMQSPHTIVVGCSDSRVPIEILFDQALGDIFVVRVAGNIVSPAQLGSVEFAASSFGTRLVVVLGHSGCGAIKAALQYRQNPTPHTSPNIQYLIDAIEPNIASVPVTATKDNNAITSNLEQDAMRANVRAVVHKMRSESMLLKSLSEQDGLEIVGAEYDVPSGRVAFLDNA